MNNFKKSDGATHIDNCGRYYKLTNTHKGFMLLNNDGDWDYCNPVTELRLIADITRIAELEKELATIIVGLFSEEELAMRDLEQQAKGVLDAVKYLGWGDIYTDTCPNMNIGRELRFVAGQLTKQAKALKERK